MIARAFLSFLALLAAQPASAQDGHFEVFGAFLEAFRKESGTPSLSAVIVKDEKIAWEGYFGTYDDEGEHPTNANTTYKIASVTKPIVATALLSEVAYGAMSLTTPMAADAGWRDLCEFFTTKTQVPFMVGGADRLGNAIAAMQCDKSATLADMLNMRVNGETFVYNPIAYARIDRALTGAGYRDLRDIVRERVIDYSLGLDYDVALGWRDRYGGSALRFLAEPFHIENGRAVKQALPDDDFRAAAGIIASPKAVAEFDIFYDTGRILLPDGRRQSLIDADIGPLGDYRDGWFLEDWNGTRLMWHSGWNEKKYSALYLKVPSKRLTLVIMANTEAIWWGNSLVKAEVVQSPVAAKFLETFAR